MERGPDSRRGASQVRRQVCDVVRNPASELAMTEVDRAYLPFFIASVIVLIIALGALAW
jgi:hypothetical protein